VHPRTTAEDPFPALTPNSCWCSLQEIKNYQGGEMNNSDNMYIKPITTPEHPDPTEALRYVDDEDGFYGYDYVCLEDATWHALCEIAHERGCTAGQLCSDIDLNFAPGEPFAPAARRPPLRGAIPRRHSRQHRATRQLLRSHRAACRAQARPCRRHRSTRPFAGNISP
jgi:predicted DNA-binding ribbon-helix-helix protein